MRGQRGQTPRGLTPSLPAYGFYPAYRLCPSCGGRLLTAVPVGRTHLRGPLHRLGVTCYCVSCNRRYRAASRLRYEWVGWMGAFGRWLWWQATSLELTLKPEES